MSEDMSSSWRFISSASSRVSSLSWDYVNIARAKISSKAGNTDGQEGGRKGWRAWAGQKLRLMKGPDDGVNRLSNETLNLFPGWAVRRYRKTSSGDVQGTFTCSYLQIRISTVSICAGAFEVEVFVSGFAISHRSLENASRSQRTFIRLAKGTVFHHDINVVKCCVYCDPENSQLERMRLKTRVAWMLEMTF